MQLARPGSAGVVTGLPLVLLRSEGVALLAMATVLYARYGRSWWLFLALLPVPDLGLLGLLRGRHAVRWPSWTVPAWWSAMAGS